jgi:TPR repeat protein
MRYVAIGFILPLGLAVLWCSSAYAQNKSACELVSKADAEAVLGVTLQPPQPNTSFRSLLDDQDFLKGPVGRVCNFTNWGPHQPRPARVVSFSLEVRYSPTPDAHAVDEVRKQVDQRTYDHPADLPGLGDAAFWTGPPNNVTLFVFRGGTVRLLIGPSDIGLDKERALALKALAALGGNGYVYGTQPVGLKKPVLSPLGTKPGGIDLLKHALTAKADEGDAKAQLALGKIYQYGTLGTDGTAQPDYAGAAYWYHQASDHGEAQAVYELAILYRDGLGVPSNASQSFELLRKAAEANYAPAMSLLSDAYAEQRTPVSGERATYWATRAAEAGDPKGWLTLGFEYSEGMLGGERPYWYRMAMSAYKKAAEGGNCIAMMEIGELYSKGNGVPQNKVQAQSWTAKAESCQGANLTLMRQKAAQYRANAAAGRDPALARSALPGVLELTPKPGVPASTSTEKLVVGLLAFVAVMAAIGALEPPSANTTGSNPNGGFNPNAIEDMNDKVNADMDMKCYLSGGMVGIFHSCNY